MRSLIGKKKQLTNQYIRKTLENSGRKELIFLHTEAQTKQLIVQQSPNG